MKVYQLYIKVFFGERLFGKVESLFKSMVKFHKSFVVVSLFVLYMAVMPKNQGEVTQLVECQIEDLMVVGSSPTLSTN